MPTILQRLLSRRRGVTGPETPQAQTAGYRPLDTRLWLNGYQLPAFDWVTIEQMKLDGMVKLALQMRAAQLTSIEWAYQDGVTEGGEPKWVSGIKASSPDVADFVQRQISRVWLNDCEALTDSQDYGWAGGEVVHRKRDGFVEIDRLEPRAAIDVRALRVDGELGGIRVDSIKDTTSKGYRELLFPYAYFVTHQAPPGQLYGRSALIGAYPSWHDKTSEGGGQDVRRLFMRKDAYGGATIYYPDGQTSVAGEVVPNRDVARQIVEQIQAGGVATLPSARDGAGHRKWELERAHVSANPVHISQYPKDLDAEIRRGIGVPDDVLDSDGSGGWAGKRVPFGAFCASLDAWARGLYGAIGWQVIDWLVRRNFGRDAWYELSHKPLAQQAMEQQSNAGDGAPSPAGNPTDPFAGMDLARMSLADAITDDLGSVRRVIDAATTTQGRSEGTPAGSFIYSYASTQFEFTGAIRRAIIQESFRFRDEDLTGAGRETEPHLTIKYGLLGDDPRPIRDIASAFAPIEVTFGDIAMFGNPDADVLWLQVESDWLRELNAAITAELPTETTHPSYTPHVTLAYLRPGTGEKYVGASSLNGLSVTFDRLILSDRSGSKIAIPLAGSSDE